MSIRASGYSISEDVLLCQVYMEISQDPITGVHQSSDHFWSRVEDKYNQDKSDSWEERSKRSLQARIQTIEKAVRKLNGCIKQVENMHPSGASSEDIINRAKMLLMQDAHYKKGFKFDHVWPIVKDFQKFKDDNKSTRHVVRSQNINNISSGSEYSPSDSPLPGSPRQSPLSFNLEDPDGGGSSRPIGVKKAKLKRKIDEQLAGTISSIKEQNDQVLEMLRKASLERQQQLEIQNRHLALNELREENKILYRDVNSIHDPRVRAIAQAEQERIIRKRAQQQQATPPSYTSNTFGQYFDDIGGSGTGLSDY